MATPYARRMFNGGALTTTVPLQIGAADSSFTLASATNWPDGSTGNFVVVVDQGSPEKILCSARSGNVVTVAASGRGYDGSSAVSHVAGSQIQCIHAAQDDDEANQVVSAVLGQASAAKGDIPVILSAAGPVTMTRLGVGANGSVLSAASATPAYSAAGTAGQALLSNGSSVPSFQTAVPVRAIDTSLVASPPAAPGPFALITGSQSVTFTSGTGVITFPSSGFANGCVSIVLTGISAGVVGAGFTVVSSTKTAATIFSTIFAGGTGFSGTVNVGYMAVGW